LLALLPCEGDIRRLETLSSSLYARYENVLNRQKEIGHTENTELRKQLAAEQLMLKQVLDWLASQPGGGTERG